MRKSFFVSFRLNQQAGGTQMSRGQQVISLLLSTMPLAERMLLYQVATAALFMSEKPLLSCCSRLGLARQQA
jgi:hypothetical protein